jgi:hypothetical protein
MTKGKVALPLGVLVVMTNPMDVVARTTKFKESATLPFVIPSAAEGSAVSLSQYQMVAGKARRADR